MLRNALLAPLFVIATNIQGMADQLPTPQGQVLLTISGNLNAKNVNGTAQFDLAMLEDLPVQTFTTSTVWIEGETEFQGVALQDLLRLIGAEGQTLGAVALNDYKVEIPFASIEHNVPIVAYKMNGEAMSPRGKGPLWIVYPYDSDEKYRTELTYSRSIWQLDRIVVTD